MEALLQFVLQWLQHIFTQLLTFLGNTFGTLIEYIANLLASFTDWIAGILSAIVDRVRTWVDSLGDFVGKILTNVRDTALAIFNKFADATSKVVDTIANYVSDVFASIKSAMGQVIDTVAGWIDGVQSSVVGLIEGGLTAVTNLAGKAVQAVESFVGGVLDAVLAWIQAQVVKLNQAFDALLGGASELIRSVNQRLTDIREGFTEAALSLVKGISETGEELFEDVGKNLRIIMESLSSWLEPNEQKALTDQIVKLNSGNASPAELRQFVSGGWRAFAPPTGIGSVLFFGALSVLGSVGFFWQASQINAQVMLQDLAKAFPFALLQPAEAAQAWRRGLIQRGTAIDAIQRGGFSSENAERLIDLTEQFPAPFEALHIWHRKLVSEAEVDKALKAHGLGDAWVDRVKEASFIIPPAADLITMAVREVFSPDVVARFGQLQDFPEEFAKFAELQGLSSDWARRYWAAHWSLPSANQGFEMLHRGVIRESDLELLLRALDVMPFWRDKLTQIAFAPFTRVDIRRMHKLGILSEAEVTKSYRDIGYNQEKALALTRFTIELNKGASADDGAELTAVSRTSVLNFFTDGLIPEQTALEMLLSLGLTTEASQLFLQSAVLDEQRKERKAEIDLTLELVKARVITFDQAESRLAKLGLETGEIAKAVANLVREQQRQTKLPSRTEAERLWRLKAISIDEYEDILEAQRYQAKWVKAFSKALQSDKA